MRRNIASEWSYKLLILDAAMILIQWRPLLMSLRDNEIARNAPAVYCTLKWWGVLR